MVGYGFGLGQHGDMTGVGVRDSGVHPGCHPLLIDARNGPVQIANEIPARFGLPGGFGYNAAECAPPLIGPCVISNIAFSASVKS
jgi:hypothetical protein